VNRIKAFIHDLAHQFKMNRGEVIFWWAAVPGFRPRAMTGFRCKGCGKVQSAREYTGPIPKKHLDRMKKAAQR
jgi:hypothetical protein